MTYAFRRGLRAVAKDLSRLGAPKLYLLEYARVLVTR